MIFKNAHPGCSYTYSNGTKDLVPMPYVHCQYNLQAGMLLSSYLPVMLGLILQTLLLHVGHHFHAVRVKMVTNIQIIVCEINQNITHKA